MSHDLIEEYLAKTKNPVQLVKHFDEVPANKIIYPLIGQRKYDGLYALVIVDDGALSVFSRTGKEYYWRLGQLIADQFCELSNNKLDDGVYIAEVCNDAVSLEILSGLVSTNRKKEWADEETESMEGQVYCMFHDFLTIDEFLDGYSEAAYMVRYYELKRRLIAANIDQYLVLNTAIYNREDADEFAEVFIKDGKEGAVFKQNTDWVAGHKGYRAMKIVRGLHLDLLCVGVEYGKGKRAGQIAKLKFAYKGSVFSADLGKGWTDEKRKQLTEHYEIYQSYEPEVQPAIKTYTPVGKIWEVKALQESSTGKALRLPKVVRVREDKEEPDA